MTDTLREAVARAICWKNGMNPDLTLGGDGENYLWMEYEAQADAALAAIREQKQAIVPDFVLKMLWEAFPWGAAKSELMEVEMKEHIKRWEND